jgi:hypothetical protein
MTKEIFEKRLRITAAFPATFCLYCFLSLSCYRHCFLITHWIKSRCTFHSVYQNSELYAVILSAVHSFCPFWWRNVWCFHTHCVIARNKIRLSTVHNWHLSQTATHTVRLPNTTALKTVCAVVSITFRGSSVGIVTRLRAGRSGVRKPALAMNFSVLQNVKTGCGGHWTRRGTLPAHEADMDTTGHSSGTWSWQLHLLPMVRIKGVYLHLSICLYIVHSDELNSTLPPTVLHIPSWGADVCSLSH